ncbi:MAG: recombinase family protein [Moorellaceae bacterium]
MRKAIVYARVSTQDQALGFSLATQKELCEKKARDLGATEIEIIEDTYTGTELHRPALDYLRRQVSERQVQLVVVYDPDRLSRDLTDLLLLCREFDGAGVRLEFVNFDWERTPQGMLFLQMRGAFAQFEHALIKERTQRGKARKAASGKIRCYARPFGYNWDAENDTLVINPAEAEIVKQMFRWLTDPTEPLSPWQIAQRLSQLYPPGPRGKGWIYTTVLRILKNPVYAGQMHRRDERPEWKPVLVPAIISPAVFAQAQERLAQAKRFNRKGTKRQYLLQGLLVCGECGRRLAVWAHGGPEGRNYSYYTCPGRYPGKRGEREGAKRCLLPSWETKKLDGAVWEALTSFLQNPDLYYPCIFPEEESYDRARQRWEEALKRLEHIRRALKRIDRAYLLLGALTEEEYQNYRREQEEALRRAKKEADRWRSVLQSREQARVTFLSSRRYAELLAEAIAGLNFSEKQNIVRELVQRIKIYADGRVEIEGHF